MRYNIMLEVKVRITIDSCTLNQGFMQGKHSLWCVSCCLGMHVMSVMVAVLYCIKG